MLRSGRYGGSELASDAMAGVTVGLIALPLALALGVASLPPGISTPFPAPALGLFTAIIGGFLISLLGGSKVQIGGPTAAFIPIVLLILEQHGYAGLVVATLMAGVILIVMGVARMGTLIKFIPWPVTSGFTTGIAVSIMVGQFADAAGLAGRAAPREFVPKLIWMGGQFGALHWPSIALAAACVAVILIWPRLGFRRIPGSIVAMVAATVVVGILGGAGIQTLGSKFGPGAIPDGFPPARLPEINWEMIRGLIGPATAIALLGAIESLLSAVVADGLSNDRHDSNTELIAQGVANLVCPLFGGLPVTGAIARTSANISNGASSPVAGMVHSLTLFGIILGAGPLAAFVPIPAMAAVLVAVALRMGEWHELRRLGTMPRSDAIVLVTTMGLTVAFDLVIAVEVGMVLAAILFIRRVAETTEISRVTSTDALETPAQMAFGKKIPEGVLVFRVFGPFLFGAAEKMEDAIERIGVLPKVLILKLHLVTAMDSTALHALESVVERMQRSGGYVILSGIHRQPLDMLKKSGFIEVIGRKNLRGTFDEALARAEELLSLRDRQPAAN